MPRDLSHFQDRENAIEAFDHLWNSNASWILALNGVAGQGKSTLLEWLEVHRCLAHSIRYVSLPIGDFSSSFHTFFARIVEAESAAFSSQDQDNFKRAYDTALENLNQRILQLNQSQTLEASPESQQTMIANVAEAVRALEFQSNALIIEAWLKLVRTLGKSEKFILLLDNYDVFQDRVSLDEIRMLWNTLERARQFVTGFRVVIASREGLRHLEHIESLRRGLSGQNLPDLSRMDSLALLTSLGVQDKQFCEAVYRLAQGHPLVTSMAAEAWRETPGGMRALDVPHLSEREKVVEWLQVYIVNRMEDILRPAAQWAMLLRWFSFEILNALLETPLSEEQYQKLTNYSFIIPSKLVNGYRAGHDLVRKVQIAYLQREQRTRFLAFHQKALKYFETVEGADLEALYHQFFIDPERAFEVWNELEGQSAFRFDHYVWGLLHELGLRDELNLPESVRAKIVFKAGRRHYYRAEWFLADEYYTEALQLFRDIGAKLGEANTLKAIGDIQQFRDDRDAALESYTEALQLFRDIGDRLGEANTLKAIGDIQQFRKDSKAALESYTEALQLFRDIGAKLGEANTLQAIGDIQQFRDDRDAALESYTEALQLFRDIGDRLGEANTLKAIGDIQQFRDDRDAALESYTEALQLFRDIGDRLGEANVYQSRGKMLVLHGNPESGLEELQAALNIYQDIGDLSGQANIYFFLGRVLAANEQREQALDLIRHAVLLGERIDPNHPVTLFMKEFLGKLEDESRAGEEEL